MESTVDTATEIASDEQVEQAVAEAIEADPAVVEAPVAPAEPDLSSKFADITRREKALRAEKNKLKSTIETERQTYISKLRSDPLSALREAGVSVDDLATALLSGTNPAPSAAPKTNDLDSIRAELDALKKDKHDQMVGNYKKQVFSVVESSPDEFELLLGSAQGKDAYWSAVIDYYNEFQEEPDFKELAKETEAKLLEHAKQWLKFKKLAPSTPAPAPEAKKATPPKTLSNKTTADSFVARSPVSPVAGSKPKAPHLALNDFLEQQTRDIKARVRAQ